MRWRLIPIFFVCMIVYAIIGGVIFHFVETKHEKNREPVLRERVQDFLDAHPCANLTRLLKLKLLLKKAEAAGLHLNRQTRSIVNLTNWDIKNSIFLASQIIGAVGYGNTTPQTVGGKLFTIFFTIVGIPLFVVFAFGVGKPIARLIRYLERRMCGAWVLHSRALESQPVPQNKAEKRAIKKVLKLRKFWVYFMRVFLLFVVGSILFVIIPAAVFNAIEPWSYGESIYFCYVTVLSVGFGDYVPGEATEKSYRNWYRLATSLYVYIGVAYFVVVFFPIQEALNFRKAINTPLTFNRDENGDAQSNHGGQDKRDWFRVGWRHSNPDLHKRPTITPAQPARPHTGSYPGPYVGRGTYGSWNSAPPGSGYGGALSGGIYGAQGGYTKSGDGLSVPQIGANRVAQGKVTSVAVNAS